MKVYKHHVIPRHEWKRRFGNLVGFNDKDNIVHLTLEQHIHVHRILYELNKNDWDRIAFQGMSGMIDKEDIHWELKSIGGKIGGSRSKGRKRPNHTQEHKKKISEARISIWRTPTEKMIQGIRRMTKTKKGTILSEDHRKHISSGLKGNQRVLGKRWKQNKIECVHCRKTGGIGQMKRYHFNNCKHLL